MRSVKLFTLSLALVTLAAAGAARAGDLGPLEPLADLHRAVHESLGLPEPLIVRLLEAGAPDEHLPVLGFLARELDQTPERIWELHRSGLSFLDITVRFGHGPELFYVPFAVDPGPPYGKAWGYYKKTPRARWSTIRLDDADIVNLVNVRVCHDHYGVPYDRVVEVRRGGKGFADVHRTLAAETGKHGKGKAAGAKGGPGQDRGKNKNKDKQGGGHGGGHGRG